MNTQEQHQVLATLLEYPTEINNALFILGDIFCDVWDDQIHCAIAEAIILAKTENINADFKYLLRNAPKKIHKELNQMKGNYEDPLILKDRCHELRIDFIKKDTQRYYTQMAQLSSENLSSAEFEEKRKLINRIKENKTSMYHAQDMVSKVLENYYNQKLNGDEITGIPTGFPELDKLTLGLQTGTAHTVGARPSIGKTAFGGQVMINVARQDIPVILISHEMTKEQIVKRCLCSMAEISMNTMSKAHLSTKTEQRMNKAAKEFAELPITIIDKTHDLEIIKKDILNHGYNNKRTNKRGLIIVDYIQKEHIMNWKGGNRNEELTAICLMWLEIAEEIDYAELWLAQLSRPGKGIEQDSHSIIILERKGHLDETKAANLMQANLKKNRDGCVGSVELEFQGWCQKITPKTSNFIPLSRNQIISQSESEALKSGSKPNIKITGEYKKTVEINENLKDNETF